MDVIAIRIPRRPDLEAWYKIPKTPRITSCEDCGLVIVTPPNRPGPCRKRCETCHPGTDHKKLWRRTNPERAKAQAKRQRRSYKARNRERWRERKRESYARNREAALARSKAWAENNREKMREYNRAYRLRKRGEAAA